MKNNLVKLVITLSMTIMCFSARAEYDFQVGGLYYKVISLEDLTCACVDVQNGPKIMRTSQYTGDIIIPSKVTLGERVFTVIEVGENAFLWSSITSIKIPKSVKVIRKNAFRNCQHLQSVVLEDGVNIIEGAAFANCTELKYVTLSNTLQEIGSGAFYDCNNLSCQIVIPSSCIFVGARALPTYSDKYSLRISDSSSPLKINHHGLGTGGRDTLYIGRDLSSNNDYVSVTKYKNLIFGDSVTTMPACSKITNDVCKIRTLGIGKSITTVPFIMFDIETICIRSSTPPKAEGFLKKNYLNTTLYVPKGSLREYQEADVWGDFWTIKEIEMK